MVRNGQDGGFLRLLLERIVANVRRACQGNGTGVHQIDLLKIALLMCHTFENVRRRRISQWQHN